ncbi:hypothetical protein BDQ17DRAFT_1435481 [Cyathus striatus]|nr:hypothetical protein BDQ17DRAFT_1435481 [Cyathus striatus]
MQVAHLPLPLLPPCHRHHVGRRPTQVSRWNVEATLIPRRSQNICQILVTASSTLCRQPHGATASNPLSSTVGYGQHLLQRPPTLISHPPQLHHLWHPPTSTSHHLPGKNGVDAVSSTPTSVLPCVYAAGKNGVNAVSSTPTFILSHVLSMPRRQAARLDAPTQNDVNAISSTSHFPPPPVTNNEAISSSFLPPSPLVTMTASMVCHQPRLPLAGIHPPQRHTTHLNVTPPT